MKHIVMFSGGVCSWAAAKRVVERHGPKDVTLLFADTKMEDEDLYRFLDESANNVGAPLVKIAEGRTPWEVMRDERIIANSRIDPCSLRLKRNLLDKWRNLHCSKTDTRIYLGLSWDEQHRIDRIQDRCKPWWYEAPLTWEPILSKRDIFQWLKREGICPPRLYHMGFPHNNCGGFCVKAGQAQFALLLRTMPERYKFHEQQEEELRKIVGDHSILRDRSDGQSRPITLREFRRRMENQMEFDMDEWGGCGCAVE
jgi:hypothetical protein